MMTKLTKPVRIIIETLFGAEVGHSLGQSVSPIVQLRETKLVSAMLADGLIEKASELLGGRFPVRIDGYILTHKGRALYCDWAGEQEIDE